MEPAPEHSAPRRVPWWVTSVILLAAAAGLTGAAWHLYPRRAVLREPSGLHMAVFDKARHPLTELNETFTLNGLRPVRDPGYDDATIGVDAVIAPPDLAHRTGPGVVDDVRFDIFLLRPDQVHHLTCRPRCTVAGESDPVATVITLPWEPTPTTTGGWSAEFSFGITGGMSLVATNGLATRVALPWIDTDELTANATEKTDFYYAGGPPLYWRAGPPPDFSPTFNNVGWNGRLADAAEPRDAEATDDSAAKRDSDRTFLSGAVIGVAGGALISGLQEALGGVSLGRRRRGPR